MAEDLELLNLGQCSTFAALLNGLDDSCFEHDDEERVRGGLAVETQLHRPSYQHAMGT